MFICVVTLCRRGDGLSRFHIVTDGGADAFAEHRRPALLGPQGGACLPTHNSICFTGDTITEAFAVD